MQTTGPKTSPKPKTTKKTQNKQEQAPSIPYQSPRPPPEESRVIVDSRTDHSCLAKWAVPCNSKLKPKKTVYSPYFEVCGFDFRFLLYPRGDSLAPPGHLSLYIQINDPRRSSRFDCFASYKLSILHHEDMSKSLTRESYYRFSGKKKTIGWCDFGLASSIFDLRSGFVTNGAVLLSAEISILDESVSFSRDNNNNNNEVEYPVSLGCESVVLNGKFTWKIKNFSLFKEFIRTQKLISSGFQLGEVSIHVTVYRSKVNGVEYLCLFLEADEAHKCLKCMAVDASSWCMFRISVLNQRAGLNHMHRDSYGRLSGVNSKGEDTTRGWTEYMKISDFLGSDKGFVVDDTVVFAVCFNAIKESNIGLSAGLRSSNVAKKSDTYVGKYSWRIENFMRLKDILKKKKLKGVFVKSRKFQIGNYEFRLVVYPRGQSQNPFHLSMFLEVLDPRNATTDWSCFASYQIAIVNQKTTDNSIIKGAVERCSTATKELGWSEFVTLTSLFDKNSGYLDKDTIIIAAEVLILKETFKMQDIPEANDNHAHKGDKKRWLITWKLENFLTVKRILAIQKIYSKYFQVDQLEFRIGVHVLSDTIYAYLECNPSVVNDPDKDFWVSYRMTIVNQKDHDKSFWKESSLRTKTCNDCDLQFMKLSDMLDANAGFVMGEMVIFDCEILDCCPWFEFSELEVLHDYVKSNELHETASSGTCKVSDGYNVNIIRDLLATARDHFNIEDNASLIILILKEELKKDLRSLTGILVGMRLYLDNPVKAKKKFLQLSGSIHTGQIDVDADKFPIKQAIMDADFMRQKIDDALLDVMVECCWRLNRKSGEDPYDASSKAYLDSNDASSQSKFNWQCRLAKFLRSFVYKRFFGFGGCTDNGSNASRKAIFGKHDSSSELHEEILRIIVNSLKAVDDTVTQDPSESSQGCQFVEKILLLIDQAPKHLLPDLVSLLPKLSYQREHKVVATALLDQLQKPGAESSMRLAVLEKMCKLHLGIDGWECTFIQASEIVRELNGEALGAAIRLLFEAASQCQHIPQAVCIVRRRLESLGPEVSCSVLDLLRTMLNSSAYLAGTMLREIGCVFSLDQKQLANCVRPSSSGDNGLATSNQKAGNHHFSNVFMLLKMLAIPSIAMETTQTFEKGIANGFIMDHLVEMVLQKCASILGVNVVSSEKHQLGDTETAGKGSMDSLYTEEVFTLVFGLVDKLFLSSNSQVLKFLRKFSPILFRVFADENHHKKMLRRLVDHATSAASSCSETSIDVLVFLVHKECKVAGLVLSMIVEGFQCANSDCSALLIQLHAKEDEHIHTKEELQTKLSKMRIENETLLKRLDKSEADNLHYKSEIRLERDRSAQVKKELEQEQAALVKLSQEKKVYEDNVNDLNTQLSALKSQYNQELKEVIEEKRLRNAEADRKRFDEEMRRCSCQVVAQEVAQKSLLNEIQQLQQNLGQVRKEMEEKEDKIGHYKTCNEALNVQLNDSQKSINSLRVSLDKEMLEHTHLYGYGLENLSMEELETLSEIFQDNLRKIRDMQILHKVRSNHRHSKNYW